MELITFTLDGHLLHTHKTTFVPSAAVVILGRISKVRQRPLRLILVISDGETSSLNPQFVYQHMP